ncbi:MAG: protein of unknown function with transrane region [Parcubacteria group bacterium]|nr:protein of unknown function with transrane region [Parcubacteria group bacterium]
MNKQPRVLKWSLIIGIIIVLNLFFNYALSLVYKSPDFLTYCPQTQIVTAPTTQDACVSAGGQWTDNSAYQAKVIPPGTDIPSGYCDTQFTCQKNYQKANDTYSRNIFAALVVLGALMVLVGNFFKGNEVISNGLALGGVLSFIIASMRYWGAANDLVRVVILAIALALLFWVAMKKFKN